MAISQKWSNLSIQGWHSQSWPFWPLFQVSNSVDYHLSFFSRLCWPNFCMCHFVTVIFVKAERKVWRGFLCRLSKAFGLRWRRWLLFGSFFGLFTYPSFCFWSGALVVCRSLTEISFLNLDFWGPFLHIRKRTGKIKLWLSEKLTEKPRAKRPLLFILQ